MVKKPKRLTLKDLYAMAVQFKPDLDYKCFSYYVCKAKGQKIDRNLYVEEAALKFLEEWKNKLNQPKTHWRKDWGGYLR